MTLADLCDMSRFDIAMNEEMVETQRALSKHMVKGWSHARSDTTGKPGLQHVLIFGL